MEIVPVKSNTNGDNTKDKNEKDTIIEEDNEDGPIYHNGKYNGKAHAKSIRLLFERDLNIPKMVESYGKDATRFIEVGSAKGGTQITLSYHPNPQAEIGTDCSWVAVQPNLEKYANKLYMDASNGKIVWKCKVLDGDVDKYILDAFQEDLVGALYDKKVDDFVKKVVKFIRFTPTKKDTTYATYINRFMQMIRTVDPKYPASKLLTICHKISASFKFHVDDKFKNAKEDVIYALLKQVSTRPSIIQCSKAVHKELDKIDENAQQAMEDLDLIEKEARLEQEKEEQERIDRMNKIAMAKNMTRPKAITGTKRPIDQVDGSENNEPPSKKTKIEVPLLDRADDDNVD